MQTHLSSEFERTTAGKEAEQIIRNCVHCGFCNATCPTYQLLGDELDGPRGRIYQMKLLLEGASPTAKMQQHLDRCLTCRACESTCPSSVRYGDLLEIGRNILDQKVSRSFFDRRFRKLLVALIPRAGLFAPLLKLGQWFRPLMPASVRVKIPPPQDVSDLHWPPPRHGRKMVALAGCVQSVLTPNTNIAAAQILDRLGISLIEAKGGGCCGAVALHTSDWEKGRQMARELIDIWMPYLDRDIEAFVMTASGCGVTVKDYPHLFGDDPVYREKAVAISRRTVDLSEILEQEDKASIRKHDQYRRVAFHAPCTLQHGQQIRGKVERILEKAGYDLCEVEADHLCCGSAGTYSILQPKLSNQLRINKQAALSIDRPDVICTANIGCQTQLQVDSALPIYHWIELLR